MQEQRRRILRQLAGGAAVTVLGSLGMGKAMAQPSGFPSRVVRLVWPYSAGGTGDQFLRPLAEILSRIWGVSVIVDSRPGAGGMIGAETVIQAEPDGHTLLVSLTGVVQTPLLYSKAPFDPVRDLVAVSELATVQQTLVASSSLPVTNMQELAEYVAKQGTPLHYGSVGLGSSSHLQMELIGRNANVPLAHVPYKGESPLMTELLGGHIQVGLVSATTARQQVPTGKLRALAVGGTVRSPLLPDTPTFQESGFSGMEKTGWFGMFAPPGTDAALVNKISADVNKALQDPTLRARMLDIGIILRGTTPSAFAEMVKQDQIYWRELIQAAGVRLD